MHKTQWVAGILAVIVLVIMAGTQVGVRAGDWFMAARAGLDMFSRVGWPVVALGALAIAFRTRERAPGFYALALLVNVGTQWTGFLGGVRPWLFIVPAGTLCLALAMLNWVPGALARWLLACAGLEAAIHWLYLYSPSWFGASPGSAAVLDLIVTAFWALFSVIAWQGATRWRPLVWLAWQGIVSVALMLFTVVQLLLPTTLGHLTFGVPSLILHPLPMLMACGFVWSAFPRTRPAA